MTTRVGIPRTLAYYSFYPQWRTYLEELGIEVVLSPPTTKDVLDMGIRYTVTDACIPIKSFHGHVAALIGKVDYILIPRMVMLPSAQSSWDSPRWLRHRWKVCRPS